MPPFYDIELSVHGNLKCKKKPRAIFSNGGLKPAHNQLIHFSVTTPLNSGLGSSYPRPTRAINDAKGALRPEGQKHARKDSQRICSGKRMS